MKTGRVPLMGGSLIRALHGISLVGRVDLQLEHLLAGLQRIAVFIRHFGPSRSAILFGGGREAVVDGGAEGLFLHQHTGMHRFEAAQALQDALLQTRLGGFRSGAIGPQDLDAVAARESQAQLGK